MTSKNTRWIVYVDSESIGVLEESVVESMIASGMLKAHDSVAPESNPLDARPLTEIFAGLVESPTMGDESLFNRSFLPFKKKYEWYIKNNDSFDGPHTLTVGQIVDLVRSGAVRSEAKLWHRSLFRIEDAHWIVHPYVERDLYEREKYAVEIAPAGPYLRDVTGAEHLEVQLGRLNFGPLGHSEIRVMLGCGQLLHNDRVRPVEDDRLDWKETPTLGAVFGDIHPGSTKNFDTGSCVLSLPFVNQYDWIISHEGIERGPESMTIGELTARIRFGLIPHDAAIRRTSVPGVTLTPLSFSDYGNERKLYNNETGSLKLISTICTHYPRPANEAEAKRRYDHIIETRRRESQRKAAVETYWGKAEDIISEGRWRLHLRA